MPAGFRSQHHRVVLGKGSDADLQALGGELLRWRLHERAGIGVEAPGPAAQGMAVTVHVGVGPLRLLAPCAVISAGVGPERAHIVYGTLQGHPECGEELFEFRLDGGILGFELASVSRPSSLLRSGPLGGVQGWVQDRLSARYLDAATALAQDRGIEP